MAIQLYTYNSFIDTIETSFATPHLQVEKFEEGFYDDMQSFETKDERFPMMWIVPTSYIHTEHSSGIYNMRVYFLDILEKDDSNERDILSDTASIARDFTNWVRLNEANGFNLLNTPTSTPVKSVLMGYTAGWYTDYQIELTTEGSDCAIPFIGTTGGTITCPDGTVVNSGSTYSATVPSDGQLILPNIPNVDSDGTIVLTPAQTPFTATTLYNPVTEQINGVTIGTISGGTNNQLIQNTVGNLIGSEANPSIIPNSDVYINSFLVAGVGIPATKDILIRVHNTTGGTVGTSTIPSIVGNSIVRNSNGTYSASVIAEESLVLPDTNIFSSASGFTDSTPSVSTGYTINDNVYTNSDGSTGNTSEYGQLIVCTPAVQELYIYIDVETGDSLSTITITSESAGDITILSDGGLTITDLQVNSTSVNVPFTIVDTDVVEITYDVAASDATITLTGTY
tara:strand:- start:37 stop:1398 length:1362 start_codon:yes stop_codon:yes gene_type:complete